MSESRIRFECSPEAIAFPARICCNCAGDHAVELRETALRLTRFMGFGGSEITWRPRLPYCDACADSAGRRPFSPLNAAIVGALGGGILSVVVTMIAILNGPGGEAVLERVGLGAVTAGCVAIGVAASLALHARKRPRPEQSSYYQPVRLRKLEQKFISGEIVGAVLGFTNPLFAERTRDQNASVTHT